MNTKLILAIVGVALVATALIGVTAAQLVGAQNQTATIYQTNPNCVSPTTGEQICVNNGTCTNTYCNGTCTGNGTYCNNTCTNACNQTQTGYCNNANVGNCQNQNAYGYGCAEQNQNQYGAGMMGRNSGFGRGCHP